MSLVKGTLVVTSDGFKAPVETLEGRSIRNIHGGFNRVRFVQELCPVNYAVLEIDDNPRNIVELTETSYLTLFSTTRKTVRYFKIDDYLGTSDNFRKTNFLYEGYLFSNDVPHFTSSFNLSVLKNTNDRLFYRLVFERKEGRYIIGQNNLVMYEPQFS